MLSVKDIKIKIILARSALFILGYILSPLTWWNDLFVNIPLAYVFALATNTILPGHLGLWFSIGYALTNITGILLIRFSIKGLSRDKLYRDLALTILYSVVAYLFLEYLLGL